VVGCQRLFESLCLTGKVDAQQCRIHKNITPRVAITLGELVCQLLEARALAQEINAAYVRMDSIEAALKNSSLRIHPAEDAGYFAAIPTNRSVRNFCLGSFASFSPAVVTRLYGPPKV
jgi:hypothetical protein